MKYSKYSWISFNCNKSSHWKILFYLNFSVSFPFAIPGPLFVFTHFLLGLNGSSPTVRHLPCPWWTPEHLSDLALATPILEWARRSSFPPCIPRVRHRVDWHCLPVNLSSSLDWDFPWKKRVYLIYVCMSRAWKNSAYSKISGKLNTFVNYWRGWLCVCSRQKCHPCSCNPYKSPLIVMLAETWLASIHFNSSSIYCALAQ